MSGDLAAAMDNALLVFKAESPTRSLIVADEKSEVRRARLGRQGPPADTDTILVPSHTAPCAPSTPRIPAHGGIFVHLCGLQVVICQLILQSELLIGLILFRTAHVGLVIRRVREDVVVLPVFLDQSHFVRRKRL